MLYVASGFNLLVDVGSEFYACDAVLDSYGQSVVVDPMLKVLDVFMGSGRSVGNVNVGQTCMGVLTRL